MKKIGILFLTVVICICCGYTQIKAEDTVTAPAFTVTDSNKNVVNSFLKDNTYYLFLTEASDLKNLVINYTDTAITSVVDANGASAVAVDPAAKTITGSFTVGETVTAETASSSYTICVMQSTLPSLYINLYDGDTSTPATTLADIHANKDTSYTGNTVTVTSTENPSWDLSASKVEMKGRGNTSWVDYEKKGYQLKFSKKTNLLGIDEGTGAKKWVLLPNSSDASMMTNKLAYDLSKDIDMPYSTKGDFVDLWVEGDYRGTYQVSDKIEIGSSRIDLSGDDVISEMDNVFYNDEPINFVDILGNHFTLKDSLADDEAQAKVQFSEFQNLIDDMEEHLPSYDWDEVTSRLNIDSLAKMYLINEYLANNEYTATSQYWYLNGVIYAGPVWDFDTATYRQGSPSSMYVYNSPIIAQLMQRQEFRDKVREVYEAYNAQFANLTSEVDELEAKLTSSAAMNYTRWDQLGKEDAKSGTFKSTYAENVADLKNWLTARRSSFSIEENGASLYMDILDDRDTVKFTYTNTNGGSDPVFAFWNLDNGQDDLTWYHSTYAGSDTWTAMASLSDHSQSGVFSLHVYEGSEIKIGMNYAVRADVATNSYDVMYRMYNPNSGEHFYTKSIEEKKMLINAGWTFEGIGWRAPLSSNTPVYRLYNPNAGDHHYTVNWNEMQSLVNTGWLYEGIGWYSDDNQTRPLYRQYNPNATAGAHNYTLSAGERDSLVAAGWKDEGIGWYGM